MPTIRIAFDVEVDKVPDSHDQKWAPMDDLIFAVEDLVLAQGIRADFPTDFSREWPSVRLVYETTKVVGVFPTPPKTEAREKAEITEGGE